MNASQEQINEPFVTNPFGDQYLYSINRNIFSQKRSVDIFTNYFYKKFDAESNFYIISGTDSGLLIKYLLEQKLPKGSQYLFIESEHLIEKIKVNLPGLEDNQKIQLCTPEQWQTVANDMHIDTYIYQYRVFFLRSIAATDLYDPTYHEINLKIELELQEYIFVLHTSIGNQSFLDQQLMNVSENLSPVIALKNIFKNKTCVILAGGPSLDDTIDWVLDNRETLIVIAVSRVANRLLKANLVPDIFVSVDPIFNSYEVSRELLISSPDILFVNTNNVNSGLLSQWHGKSAFFGKMLPWESALNLENIDGSGPTVTNSAISLAIFMGINRILLAGVDLCNSQSGHSHASGSVEADTRGANLAFIGVNTTTYAGENAETTVQMSIAARVLEAQAGQANTLGVSMINLSANAAVIDHITHQAPHCINLEQPVNVGRVIAKNLAEKDLQSRIQHNKNILAEIDNLLADSQVIVSLAEQALDFNKQSFDTSIADEDAYQFSVKMDEIEEQLNNQYKTAASFIKEYGIKHFIKCVQPKDNEEWDNKQSELAGQLYYQAYIESAKEVDIKLKQTQKRLLSRLEELSDSPDINKIIAQWEEDRQPGRYRILNNLQPNLAPAVSDNKKLAEQVKRFDELMFGSTHFKLAVEKECPMAGIRKKILLLFRQQDEQGLAKLAQGLFAFAESKEEAAPLYYMCQAYLLTLREDYKHSLYAFEDMETENIGEDELLQISSNALKLQLPELAESALSMLINYNDMYLPQYANILRLAGKIEDSIDTYIKYLNTYDMDLYNWLELGKLFIEIGADESAKLAFEKVLSLDEDNVTGRELLSKISMKQK